MRHATTLAYAAAIGFGAGQVPWWLALPALFILTFLYLEHIE